MNRRLIFLKLRLIFLKLLTCTVGCAVFLPVIAVFILASMGDDTYAEELLSAEVMLTIARVGAALGMWVGIVWTIKNWLARLHVMLWTGMGLVVGIVFSILTNSGVPLVVFSAAGIFVEIVCALATVGAFRDK